MNAPFVKVHREHRKVADVEHSWIVDRQRPVEQMDSNGRRSYVGGQTWVSLRCGARRGCDARAFVIESELIDCIDFPLPRKRGQQVPAALLEPVPTPPESDFERALTQAAITAAFEAVSSPLAAALPEPIVDPVTGTSIPASPKVTITMNPEQAAAPLPGATKRTRTRKPRGES